jgi:hypothetical protein
VESLQIGEVEKEKARGLRPVLIQSFKNCGRELAAVLRFP